MKTQHFAVALLAASIFFSGASCTNRNYVDLMRVTEETDTSIASCEETYNGTGSVAERMKARDRIINLRKKQMIMATRINVSTMPAVKDKTMTPAEGQAKKTELVEAATKRYEDAKKLPVPGK
jgi:cytochrome c biogenesis factor